MAIDYELHPGQMVGEYRVDRKIGEGGFGKVYAATHPVIGKAAAIKILNPELAKSEEMVSRFVSEARAVNQIRHRHIIDIFSFGTLPGPLHYFVMEMLEGQTLDSYLEKNGPLEPGHALSLLWPIGRALVAAHKAGITHRDLKPENVFLTIDPDGGVFPKLLDFGIAKLLHESEMAHRTRTGAMLGTPIYMSPEQCRGGQIDHRSDIYSFGIMIHEVLTGSRPFNGETLMDLLMKQVAEPAPPMSRTRPGLGPAMDQAVLHMLEKMPDRRPESMQAALDELARAAEAGGIAVPQSAHIAAASRGSAPGVAPGQRGSGTPSGVTPPGTSVDTNAWLQQQAGVPAGQSQTGSPRTGAGQAVSGQGQHPSGAGQAVSGQGQHPSGAGQDPHAVGPTHPSYQHGQYPQPGALQQGQWAANAQSAYSPQAQGYPLAGGPMPQGAPLPAKKRPPSAIGIVAAIVAGIFFLFFVGFVALVAVSSGDADSVQIGAAAPGVGEPVERQLTSDLTMKLTPPGAQFPTGSSTVHMHRRFQLTPQTVGSSRVQRASVQYFEDIVQTRVSDGSDETESNPTANQVFIVAGTGSALAVSSNDGSPVDDLARRCVLRDVGRFFEPAPAMFNHELHKGEALTPSSEVVVAILGLADPTEGVRVRADNASFKLQSIDTSAGRAVFDVTFLYVYDDTSLHLTSAVTGTLTFETATGLFVTGMLGGPVEGSFSNDKGRMSVSGTLSMEGR